MNLYITKNFFTNFLFIMKSSHIKKVTEICFSLVNPENLRKDAVCKISSSDLYDNNKQPKEGGINDSRMGPVNENEECATCGKTAEFCQGHFGYVELFKPSYNPIHLKIVSAILSIVCPDCGSLMIDKNNQTLMDSILFKDKRDRIAALKKEIGTGHNRKCPQCDSYITKYSKDGLYLKEIKSVNGKKGPLSKFYGSEAIKILKKISDEDIKILGMDPVHSRPEWLLFEAYPVIPPCVRPSITFGCNLRCEDDLVYKLTSLVKANNHFEAKSNNKNKAYIDFYEENSQWNVTTIIDNSNRSVPQSVHKNNGRTLSSLKDRIKGKEGRIRGNLLGKRVDFSARTVIGPDPNIEIDEVGMPIEICKVLTFPEKVNRYNITSLQRVVARGAKKYPGANYIVRDHTRCIHEGCSVKATHNVEEEKEKETQKAIYCSLHAKPGMVELDKDLLLTETTISLKYGQARETVLRYGDIVHRHLTNIDYVLFNRQPSLHKMSMMGHRVRPTKGKSFKLNPAVTTPYNADFDGDEMNITVPQNRISQLEVKYIANVQKQLISPQFNAPIIGLIMDNVLGSYLLSLDDTYIKEDYLYNFVLKLPQFDGELPPPTRIVNGEREWSGKSLYSMLFPKVNGEEFDFQRGDIRVEKGVLTSGILNKSAIKSSGSIIHMLNNDAGYKAASEFINNAQYLTNRYLEFRGFSVGYDDIKRTKSLQKSNAIAISDAKKTVHDFIEDTYTSRAKKSVEEFEQFIFNTLNKARDSIGSNVMKTIDKKNSFYQLINSGAKGNVLNISQILGSVGQQNVQWKKKSGRVPLILNNRSLPYYYQNDSSPEARGFVEHSYVDGLDITEFFFHMIAGRNGVIDTSCKTSEIGYLQRKLIKSLEDIKIAYDMTVRNEGNRIVQFTYGSQNADTLGQEKQRLDIAMINDKEFISRFRWSIDALKESYSGKGGVTINKAPLMEEYTNLYNLRVKLRERGFYEKEFTYQAINFKRIVKQAMLQTFENESLLMPEYVIDEVSKLQEIITVTPNKAFPWNEINDHNLLPLRALLHAEMNTKVLIHGNGATKEQFDVMVSQVKNKFYKNIIDPGMSVGTISAQSIGEPCTQLTLNTFHQCGISSKSSVNQGVPRISELISISKNIKTPSLTIYMNDSVKSKEQAKALIPEIKEITLDSLITSTEIWYDPDPLNSLIEEDREFLQDYYDFAEDDIDMEQLSPWVLRIEIDPIFLLNHKLTMYEIYYYLNLHFTKEKIHIIYSDENSQNMVFHIRFLHQDINANMREKKKKEAKKGKRGKKKKKEEEEKKDEEKKEEEEIKEPEPEIDLSEYENVPITSEDYEELIKIERTLTSGFLLKGVKNISKVTIREIKEPSINKETGSIEMKKRIVMDTLGTNLTDVFKKKDFVDPLKTYSNDIYEVYNTLGVEATRELLKQEIYLVLGQSGVYVNEAHVNLLVDNMTLNGGLIPMNRYGITKLDNGVFSMASFEEPHDHLSTAAVYAISDKMKGISANTIMGQLGEFGTGLPKVEFDVQKLMKNMKPWDNKVKKNVKINKFLDLQSFQLPDIEEDEVM